MASRWMRVGLAVGVGVLLAAALGVTTAHAQGPFTAYGTGLAPGDVVEASIGGTSCGTATADADGNWILRIEASSACGPVEGDQIAFSRNGIPAGDVATWTAGGTPATSGFDPDVGITLMTATSGPSEGVPEPADTGSWGLSAAGPADAATLTLLSLLAAALILGGRVATGRID